MTSIGDFGNLTVGANGQVSFSGLESNVDTAEIVQALLTPYTDQVNSIKSAQTAYTTQVSDWQTINTDLASLQSAADDINTSFDWEAATANSSNSSVATATAETGTPQGTVSFTVNSLASSDSWISSGTVASTGTVVDSNPGFLLSQASQYGFTSLVGDSALSIGAHTLDVNQAISAASTTGDTLLPSSVTITGSNNQFTATINGVTNTFTIAAGTYSTTSTGAGSLTDAIQGATDGDANTFAEDGGTAITSGGYLTLATSLQGSDASLQVSGGDALGTLGIAAMASANVGTSGSVTVDGTVNNFNDLETGDTVTLNSGDGGSITATLGGGTGNTSGTFTATNVSTGTGSLADVVASINDAGAGVTASAVQTGGGGYILQLSSTGTGTDSAVTTDANAFSASSLGTMENNQQGSDASITVGGGYTVTSQTNTVSGLLPGLSVSLLSTSSSPVTVSVSTDTQGLVTDVQNLVNAANQVLSDLNTYGGYNATTQTAGPLAGQSAVDSLTQQVLGVFATTVGTSGFGSALQAGLAVDYNSGTGQTTIQFDQSTFESELASDPTAVAGLFAQGGTFSASSGLGTGTVFFSAATDGTLAGSYAVDITSPATQADDVGTNTGGVVTTGGDETLTIDQSGGPTTTYTTTVGETFSQVVQGLNTAFADTGAGLSAEIGGGGEIDVTSTGYGSGESFTVSSSNPDGSTGLAGTFTGSDVAGTINGVASTGSGQFLTAPYNDPTLAGLTLLVSATAAGTGTFTYSPGIAQALTTTADEFSSPVDGVITSTITGLNNASDSLDSQITFYQALEDSEQTALENEFSQMESTLGTLKNQATYLQDAMSEGV